MGHPLLNTEDPHCLEALHRARSRPSYVGTDTDHQKNDLYGKEPMHVYLRVRPLTTSEIEKNESKDCVSIQDSCSVLVKAPQTSLTGRLSDKARALIAQNFTFTQVFGPETSQTQFFDGTMKQQVMDFMEGQNHLLFTYGVTNAGKTFTFQGSYFGFLQDGLSICQKKSARKRATEHWE
ncbi:kinesin-like protein KIF20A [Ascaphus truei]|uniref:kinesin-like protein KIF20A n=1 Tax=Ascaphus truei TaxID=8439 RepID=UPI003F59F52E